jgi:hypothetical protein
MVIMAIMVFIDFAVIMVIMANMVTIVTRFLLLTRLFYTKFMKLIRIAMLKIF